MQPGRPAASARAATAGTAAASAGAGAALAAATAAVARAAAIAGAMPATVMMAAIWAGAVAAAALAAAAGTATVPPAAALAVAMTVAVPWSAALPRGLPRWAASARTSTAAVTAVAERCRYDDSRRAECREQGKPQQQLPRFLSRDDLPETLNAGPPEKAQEYLHPTYRPYYLRTLVMDRRVGRMS